MPTFERTSRRYYTISKEDHPEGLIRRKDREGNVYHTGGIEGILTSIELKEEEWEGERQIKWHFKFEDRAHSQTDILQIGETASAARGLLMTLVSCPGKAGWVSVAPYRSKNEDKTYTNVWVEINGQTVDWLEEVQENLPEVEYVEVGDKQVPNDTDRRQYVRKLAQRVLNEKLAGTIVHPDGTEATYSGDEAPTPAETQPQKKNPSQPTGHAPAETLYGEDEPAETAEPQTKVPPKENDVDMTSWEDIDDDLPF